MVPEEGPFSKLLLVPEEGPWLSLTFHSNHCVHVCILHIFQHKYIPGNDGPSSGTIISNFKIMGPPQEPKNETWDIHLLQGIKPLWLLKEPQNQIKPNINRKFQTREGRINQSISSSPMHDLCCGDGCCWFLFAFWHAIFFFFVIIIVPHDCGHQQWLLVSDYHADCFVPHTFPLPYQIWSQPL